MARYLWLDTGHPPAETGGFELPVPLGVTYAEIVQDRRDGADVEPFQPYKLPHGNAEKRQVLSPPIPIGDTGNVVKQVTLCSEPLPGSSQLVKPPVQLRLMVVPSWLERE